MGGIGTEKSIALRRELEVRAAVRHAMVEAWEEGKHDDNRRFSIIDARLPRLNVGMGSWRKQAREQRLLGQ